MSQAGLYLVATPIGNLEDISYRAVRVLSDADLIAAEDTRHSRVLLAHHGITTPVMSLHEHNEAEVMGRVLEQLSAGKAVALISDAGTPVLSDPGYRLVCAARDAALPVHVVPGPSAITAALCVAGLPPDRFVFEGFLPSRAAARRRKLEELRTEPRTMLFFESCHRIGEALADMAEVFGADRPAAVCRELTKKFETVLRSSLAGLVARLEADRDQTRGEFVIVVQGHALELDEAHEKAVRLARELLDYLPVSQAARVAAKLHGVSRREVYQSLGK